MLSQIKSLKMSNRNSYVCSAFTYIDSQSNCCKHRHPDRTTNNSVYHWKMQFDTTLQYTCTYNFHKLIVWWRSTAINCQISRSNRKINYDGKKIAVRGATRYLVRILWTHQNSWWLNFRGMYPSFTNLHPQRNNKK